MQIGSENLYPIHCFSRWKKGFIKRLVLPTLQKKEASYLRKVQWCKHFLPLFGNRFVNEIEGDVQ